MLASSNPHYSFSKRYILNLSRDYFFNFLHDNSSLTYEIKVADIIRS